MCIRPWFIRLTRNGKGTGSNTNGKVRVRHEQGRRARDELARYRLAMKGFLDFLQTPNLTLGAKR